MLETWDMRRSGRDSAHPNTFPPSASMGEARQGRSAMSPPVFHVVTPSLNMVRYIDETIESVIGQSGDFTIRYHIQDGGSTDGTLEIARRWRDRAEAKDFPLHCRGVHVTVESRPDGGMYEAIAAGFRHLAPAPRDLMTWINADDLLAPGALSAIACAFRDLPQIQLVGGRHALIDARGEDCGSNALIAYPRSCVAAGLHDGRHLPFIQQEGTFWRAHLWMRAEGIDPTFRLAGDFDLWRRFAAVAEHITLDAVIGFHRQHADQLSADLGAYYREIDERRAGWARQCHRTFRYYRVWHDRTRADGHFSARIARRDAETGEWMLVDWHPPAPVRNVLHPFDGDWTTESGFDDPEGPFPDLGIDRQVRWIVSQPARLTLFSARRGRRTVSLLVRGMVPGQQLEISIDGKARHRWTLQGRFPEAERLTVTQPFKRGPCQMDIRIDEWRRSAEGRQLGVILEAVEFEPPASWRVYGMEALDSRSRIRPWLGQLRARVARGQRWASGHTFALLRRLTERRARAFRGAVAIEDARVVQPLRGEGDSP
jgi:glycosyltransferase involved in cell wall biosynthesis